MVAPFGADAARQRPRRGGARGRARAHARSATGIDAGRAVEPALEDVFIHLMAGAKDNFAMTRHATAFSLRRGSCGTCSSKEFIQLRRDRLTFAMIVGIPIMQLVLFGYAINTDPKHLPTAVLVADHSDFTRSLARGHAEHRLLRRRAGRASAGRGSTACSRPGDVAVRRHDPGRASRATLLRGERPAAPGRGRRHRPRRHRQRARGAAGT